MAIDLYLDPVTHDYVDDGEGGWIETDDNSTAVLVQLDSREGRWWGDPPAGSRNKEILESDLPTAEALLDSSKRALAKMAQAGAISNVVGQLTDEDNATGYASMLFQWFDRSALRPADLAYSPLGGAPIVT